MKIRQVVGILRKLRMLGRLAGGNCYDRGSARDNNTKYTYLHL